MTVFILLQHIDHGDGSADSEVICCCSSLIAAKDASKLHTSASLLYIQEWDIKPMGSIKNSWQKYPKCKWVQFVKNYEWIAA